MILYPSGLLITDFGTIEDGVLLALVVLSRAAGKKNECTEGHFKLYS